MTRGATWSEEISRRRFLRMAGAGGVAVASSSVLASCSRGGGGPDTLKVGVVAPFTGPGAFLGTVMSNSLEASVRKVNADGGLKGRKVEVLLRDASDDPDVASQLYDELARQDGMVGLLWGGALGLERLIPKMEQGGLPVVAVFGDPFSEGLLQPVSTARSPLFQTAVPDDYAMTVLASYASDDRGYSTAALLYDVGREPEGTKPARFERTFRQAGFDVLGVEGFATDDVSYEEQLRRLQGPVPHVLYVDGNPSDLAAIVKELDRMGASYVDAPTAKGPQWHPHVFVGPAGGTDQTWLAEAGDAVASGTVSSGHVGGVIARPDFAVGDWMRRFVGKEPTGGEESPADGLGAILEALQKAGTTDRARLVGAMESLDRVTFASLPFSFSRDRHVARTADDVVVLTVEHLRGPVPTDPPYQLGREWQGDGFFKGSAAGMTWLVRPTLEGNRRAHPEVVGQVLTEGFGTQCTKRPDGTLSPACKIH